MYVYVLNTFAAVSQIFLDEAQRFVYKFHKPQPKTFIDDVVAFGGKSPTPVRINQQKLAMQIRGCLIFRSDILRALTIVIYIHVKSEAAQQQTNGHESVAHRRIVTDQCVWLRQSHLSGLFKLIRS